MHDTPGRRGGPNAKKFKRRGSLAWLDKKKEEDMEGEAAYETPLPSSEPSEAEAAGARHQRLVDMGVIGTMKRFPGSAQLPELDANDAMADTHELVKKVIHFDTSKPDPRTNDDSMNIIFRNVDQTNRLLEKARAAYPPTTPEQETNPASAVPEEVYSKMIRLLTLAWNLRGAMRVLEEMREKGGLKPTVEAYGALVCAWERNLDVEMANRMRRLCFDDHPGIDVDESMPRELEETLEELQAGFVSKYGIAERNLTPEEYLEQQQQQ